MGNVSHTYGLEDGSFDYDAYMEALHDDMLNIAQSSLLHIWSPDNMDHMRLPRFNDIHNFLTRDLRILFYRWLHVIGTNAGLPQAGQTVAQMESNRVYLAAISFREYMIYHVLLQALGGPAFDNLRLELGSIYSTTRSDTLTLVKQAELQYDDSTYAQRQAWKQQYSSSFEDYKAANGYAAENILYTPAYPDIIFSTRSGGIDVTGDSPHIKIPPVISYYIRKSAPASTNKTPFGPNKDWKWNEAGEFFDANKENVYRLRFRRWENLVEFTTVWRSGAEAESLCVLFEQFMDLNERYFQEAGIDKIIPYGRTKEPDVRLDTAGVHYRKTHWYFKTQQFQFYGPVTRISDVDLDIIPTSRRET